MPIVSCKRCEGNFAVKQSAIERGNGKYCSMKCYLDAKHLGKEVLCEICKTKVYRNPKAISRSKSGLFFCSKNCQTIWRNKLYIGKEHKNFTTGKASYREVMKRQDFKKACQVCKTEDFRVLAVHHIDKNRHNNDLKNLAWLCHNCHYLVHHYEREYAQFMAAMV